MAHGYDIAKKYFTTKEKIINYFWGVLTNKSLPEEELIGDALEFAIELLSHHPKWEDKSNKAIDKIIIKPHTLWKRNRSVYLVYEDGTIDDISIKKAVASL